MVNYKINVYLKHTEMENMYVREFIELVTQDINGNNFEFTVYEDDNVYDLTNKRVTMIVKSDSGTVIQENCQVVDAKQGKATITLPPDMLIENGPYMAEVQIWEGVNSRVTTLPFDYTVRLSLENDESIKADPRFSLLQVALQNVNDADGKSKEALKLSKEAKAICDDLVPKANTAAQNAQTALDRAESVVTQEELAQKVMLGGAPQTKFDFIKNQVVKDGLIEYVNKKITGAHVVNKLDISNDFTLVGCIRNYNKTTLWYVPNVGQMRLVVDAQSNKLTINGFEDKRILETDVTPTIEFAVIKQGSRFTISINGIIAVTDLKYADEDIINKWNTNKFSFGYNSATLEVEYTCNNRALAQQEIQHIFSVINNTPSIKELYTTNAEGETSILKLGSDEDHVEMSTGRTLREEYMGVLKAMGKEVPSADGSPIQVPNGIEARIINAEIKGQTVKNYAPAWVDGFTTSYQKNKDRITISEYDGQVASSGEWIKQLKPNTNYTVFINVLENTCTRENIFMNNEAAGALNTALVKIGAKQTGWLSFDFTTKETFDKWVWTARASSGEILVAENPVIVERADKNKVIKYIPFGLAPTQAIISNNGEPYPIYANEEDEANKKVISLPFPEDKLILNEDGSATWIDASNRKTLNNNEPWIKSSVQNAEANCFQIEIIDADNNGNSVIVFCDKLESVTGASTLSAGTLKPNTCGIDGSRYLRVGVPKTVDTVEQMKEFAQNLNIIYRSKIQEITHIDKSIVPTILTHKTNILEVGGAVKPSSFKVTLPVDRIAELTARLEAVEAKTNTQPVNTAFVDETYAKSVNKIEEVIK